MNDIGRKLSSASPGQTVPPADASDSVRAQNHRGEWVPAIPEPFHGRRERCSCGAKFWTREGYRGHYALVHILGLGK